MICRWYVTPQHRVIRTDASLIDHVPPSWPRMEGSREDAVAWAASHGIAAEDVPQLPEPEEDLSGAG